MIGDKRSIIYSFSSTFSYQASLRREQYEKFLL